MNEILKPSTGNSLRKWPDGMEGVQNRKEAEKIAANSGQEVREGEAAQARLPDQDSVEWSEQWTDMDWKQAITDVVEGLRQQYPGINIILEEEGEQNLSDTAASLGTGGHLILSREFLERMKSGREEFGKCCSAIATAAKQLERNSKKAPGVGAYMGESQVTFWSLSPETGGAENQQSIAAITAHTNKTFEDSKNKKRITMTTSFNISKYYSKVAAARKKGQVNQVLGQVRRQIVNLSLAASLGDPSQQLKARRAVRSLQKLLNKGGRKVRRLGQEELREDAEKKARKREQRRKELMLKAELKRMRSARRSSDYALAQEGRADEKRIKGYQQYRAGWEFSFPPLSPSTGQFYPSAGFEGSGGGGDFTSADVSVSQGFTF